MEQAVVIPACGSDSACDGTLGLAGVGFEKVEHPVKPVLDAPLAAHGAREFFYIQLQAAQVVAALDAGLVFDVAHGFEDALAVGKREGMAHFLEDGEEHWEQVGRGQERWRVRNQTPAPCP